MLPDYFIKEQLEKLRRERRGEERLQIERPRRSPWDEAEERSERRRGINYDYDYDQDAERGEWIIRM